MSVERGPPVGGGAGAGPAAGPAAEPEAAPPYSDSPLPTAATAAAPSFTPRPSPPPAYPDEKKSAYLHDYYHNRVVLGPKAALSQPPQPPQQPPRLCVRLLRLVLYSLVVTALSAGLCSLAGRRSQAHEPAVNLNSAERLGYTQLRDLPPCYIPHRGETANPPQKRLVFIGDVHGMFAELKELLQKLEYNKYVDHLVFTGDVVTKGPDSLRVVDFARQHGASCVRGNQDDRILLHHRSLAPAASAAGKPQGGELSELDKKVHDEKNLARHMTDEQAAWLDSCPLMLRARDVYGLGDVVVVHAGLVQGVALEQQDPFAVMNMRTIHAKMRVPSSKTNGMHWARLWNKFEARRRKPVTVIYGHYAAKGLDIRPLTKGIDSNCVRGGNLTALVVSTKSPTPDIVSVACRRLYDQ